jgi:hypothetical protein
VIREISPAPGLSRLGTISKSISAKATKYPLGCIVCYADIQGGRSVGIRFHRDAFGNSPPADVVLNLTPTAALELVKGILQNTPDISIAADDELNRIVREANERSSKDAEAVVKAVLERHEPK